MPERARSLHPAPLVNSETHCLVDRPQLRSGDMRCTSAALACCRGACQRPLTWTWRVKRKLIAPSDSLCPSLARWPAIGRGLQLCSPCNP